MLLNRRSILALGALALPLFAQESFIELRAGYYDQTDEGGNPTLDEDETVIEPILIGRWQATEELGLNFGLYYDYVSSASIDRLHETDGQSGASGDNYIGGYLGFDYAFGESQIGATISSSTEYDYQSLGLGLHYALWLNERQSRLRLSANVFYDTVERILFDGTEDGDENRLSLSFGTSFQHIITPTITGSLGATVAYQTGSLESSINRVLVRDNRRLLVHPLGSDDDFFFRGFEAAEVLPDSRVRFALYGRLDKYLDWEDFPDTAIGAGSRFYADDWGILAWDLEPSVRQWIVEDVFMVEAHYRFYVQSESDFYEEEFFDTVKGEMTSDPDLGAFISHTFGTQFVLWITDNMSIDFALDYMLRDDDVDAFWGSVGWKLTF